MNASLFFLGVLPVLLFAILDTKTSKKWAIISATIAGVIEILFSIFYSNGIDFLTVMVLVLLAVSVILSLKMNDSFYFKISGSVSWILFSGIMIFSVIALKEPMLTTMMEKYIGFDELVKSTPNLDVNLFKLMLDKLSFSLPFFIILHSAVAIYAAKFWNRWIWAFLRISNPFFEVIILSAYYGSVLR